MTTNLSSPFSIRLPEDVLATVEQIAKETERSRNWVILRALRFYLVNEGADVLAFAEGQRQVEAGEVHDMDEVLTDLRKRLRLPSDEAA